MVRPGTGGIPGRPGIADVRGRCNPLEREDTPTKLDRGEPAGLDLDVHVLVDGPVDPGAFQQVRRHAGSPASSARTSRQADTPARQSSIPAVSSGEWETPVGLRTKSIAVGMPAADRMPASWPAAVGMTGHPRGPPAGRRARVRTPRIPTPTPGSSPARCRRARLAPTPAARWHRPGPPGSEPTTPARPATRSHPRDGVGRVRGHLEPPERGALTGERACLLAARAVIAYVSIGSARSSIRVVPAWSADPVNSYR